MRKLNRGVVDHHAGLCSSGADEPLSSNVFCFLKLIVMRLFLFDFLAARGRFIVIILSLIL